MKFLILRRHCMQKWILYKDKENWKLKSNKKDINNWIIQQNNILINVLVKV
jgi:hypothetical protein